MASTSAGASGMNAYEILGVQSAATTDEIKRAYKKLALQLHPDKVSRTTKTDAERDEARVRFRNVANAYEVLKDEGSRAAYDQKCELNGAKRDDVLVNVSFKESVTGTTKLAMIPFKLLCSSCQGVGMACLKCEGCANRGGTAVGSQGTCGTCDGRGFGKPETCRKCGGDGVKDDFFHGRVHVPAGVLDGSRLPISGRTQHVRVRILPSKVFSRDGLNVTSTLRLSAKDALEGGFFEVETVHGVETMYFDEETKSGDTKALDGKGIKDGKKIGNHIVRVEVEREQTPEAVEADEDVEEAEEPEASEADEPATKKQKESIEDQEEVIDLERLLAEKKAKLLAQLNAQS